MREIIRLLILMFTNLCIPNQFNILNPSNFLSKIQIF